MQSVDTSRAGGPGLAPRALALCLAASLCLGSAPVRAAGDTFDADTEDEAELVEEPGFFGTYFPFTPDDNLPAPVDQAMVPIYLLNLLPFGGIWGPLAAIDKEGRPEMGGDMVLPWLVPNLTAGVGSLCVMSPVLFGGMFAGLLVGFAIQGALGGVCPAPCVCVPCGMAPGLLLGLPLVALQLWTAPTAVINAWGRAYTSRDSALPEQVQPAPQPTPQPSPEAPVAPAPAPEPAQPAPPATPAPAQPPAGEWGPAEQPAAPPTPVPPKVPDAANKKPGANKPADTKPDDEGEWVPY